MDWLSVVWFRRGGCTSKSSFCCPSLNFFSVLLIILIWLSCILSQVEVCLVSSSRTLAPVYSWSIILSQKYHYIPVHWSTMIYLLPQHPFVGYLLSYFASHLIISPDYRLKSQDDRSFCNSVCDRTLQPLCSPGCIIFKWHRPQQGCICSLFNACCWAVVYLLL